MIKPFTDQQLQDWLLHYGYKVPMLVIRTWGGANSHINRRTQVENWIRGRQRGKWFRAYPEFLNFFEINLRHKMEKRKCQNIQAPYKTNLPRLKAGTTGQ